MAAMTSGLSLLHAQRPPVADARKLAERV